jgi:transcriptional regulator with XRE-family HTH domain
MLSEMIKSLRENAGYSQSQLAKKLDVTRSSVNAWEMGLSTPTTPYIVEMAKLFHVSTDYILGIHNTQTLVLDGYSNREIELIYNLVKYFDEKR